MSYFKSKNKDDTSDIVQKMLGRLDNISVKLEDIGNLMAKIWKAEDEEAGVYNFPFDEEGNLLPNVSLTSEGEYIEDGKTGD
jgi:hypothetical protein